MAIENTPPDLVQRRAEILELCEEVRRREALALAADYGDGTHGPLIDALMALGYRAADIELLLKEQGK